MRAGWRGGMIFGLRLKVFVLVAAGAFGDASHAASPGPMNWLVQDVCVNAQNQAMPVDPGAGNGRGCKDAGLAERDLLPGEALPYDKFDQFLVMMVDSYPALSADGTQTLAINPKVNVATPGVSGAYDVHGLKGGWIYGMSTNDPIDYGTNFFGSVCSSTGLPWFPTTNNEVLDGAATGPGGSGGYYEHNGQAWPGDCPAGNPSSLVMWSYRNFTYGGINSNKIKSLPTMIAFTGVPSAANIPTCSQLSPTSAEYKQKCQRYAEFLQQHIELQFLTRQYGLTRWESWKPARTGLSADTKDCNGTAVTEDLYGMAELNGLNMIRVACSDYTNIVIPPTPYIANQAEVGRLGAGGQVIPSWPVPHLNLLRDWHFNTVAGFSSDAGWTTVGGATLSFGQSKAICDITLCGRYVVNTTVYAGPRYATLQCIGGNCSPYAALYQDVPISSSPVIGDGMYTFGTRIAAFTVNTPGQVALTLSEIAEDHKTVLSSTSVVVEPKSSCSSGAAYTWCSNSSMTSTSTSVLKSARYYASTTPLSVEPGAAYLRFNIAPQTSDPYTIIDAWLMKVQ